MVTMEPEQYAFERAERIGGHPALDFVNTVQAWEDGRPGDEYLVDYAALLRWHATVGLLDGRSLQRLGAGSPAARRRAWREALRLRLVLQRIFSRVAGGRRPRGEDLDALHHVLERTIQRRRLAATGSAASLEITFEWDLGGAPPAAILGPVAWSAAELLQYGPLDRLKACPFGEGCGWLFLDLSKNRSRTWCSMKTCGNVAKARRFRARL